MSSRVLEYHGTPLGPSSLVVLGQSKDDFLSHQRALGRIYRKHPFHRPCHTRVLRWYSVGQVHR